MSMHKGHQFAHVALAKHELIRRVTGGQAVKEALREMGYTRTITSWWSRGDDAFREMLREAKRSQRSMRRRDTIERFLALIEAGHSTTAASLGVGVSTRWYTNAVIRHPVYGREYRRLRREQSRPDFARRFAVLIECLASGIAITEAAKRAHMARETVLRMSRGNDAHGARIRAATLAGGVTWTPNSRGLEAQDVARLRRLVREGAYMSEIAASEGLCLATVHRVITGRGSVAYARTCGGEPPVDLRAEGLFRRGSHPGSRSQEHAA